MIQRLRSRISQIEEEIAQLTASGMAKLLTQVETRSGKGQGLTCRKWRTIYGAVSHSNAGNPRLRLGGVGVHDAGRKRTRTVGAGVHRCHHQKSENSLAARSRADLRRRKSADEWVRKGIEFDGQQEFSKAFECFQRGIEVDPEIANCKCISVISWSLLPFRMGLRPEL
jgi:hypothetical protein